MSHTKGPWHYEITSATTPDCICISVNHEVKDYNYRGAICSIQSCEHIGGITMSEAEDNARIIAAAPEMLDALMVAEEYLDIAQSLLEQSNHHAKILSAYRQARAAIAKVTKEPVPA